jgi:2-oxoglutarate dehydrogenase E1 component
LASFNDNEDFLFSSGSVFAEELYNLYLQNPHNVDPTWRIYFDSLGDKLSYKRESFSYNSVTTKSDFEDLRSDRNLPKDISNEIISLKIELFSRAYRERGHFLANLDLLSLEILRTKQELELEPKDFAISSQDLNSYVTLKNPINGRGAIYCKRSHKSA